MGNVSAARRGSVLSKEGSVVGEGKGSRQNTLAEDAAPEPLSEQQRADLTRTWKMLEDDIAKVGVITFISSTSEDEHEQEQVEEEEATSLVYWSTEGINVQVVGEPPPSCLTLSQGQTSVKIGSLLTSLFETHPDVQQVFMPFSGIELEDLKHSTQLRAHALRVMGFVQKCISRLHEPEKLEQLLRELGKKHHSYKAKARYVDLVGPQFIQAIQPSLGPEWTEPVSSAWLLLFAHIGYTMKAAMAEEAVREKL